MQKITRLDWFFSICAVLKALLSLLCELRTNGKTTEGWNAVTPHTETF